MQNKTRTHIDFPHFRVIFDAPRWLSKSFEHHTWMSNDDRIPGVVYILLRHDEERPFQQHHAVSVLHFVLRNVTCV